MLSIFPARGDSPRFRLRWCGYDRAQVDQFLSQTAAERKQLEEDLAQLAVVMAGQSEERRNEIERLTRLRTEVAGCLESSIDALRTATERLSAESAAAAQRPATPAPAPARGATPRRFRLPRWPRPVNVPRPRAVAAAALVSSLIPVTLFYQSMSGKTAAQPREAAGAVGSAVTGRSAAAPPAAISAAMDSPVAMPVYAPEQTAGVVLTLTGKRDCWLSMRLDGGEKFDRLLKMGETIMLRANTEAVLRVGDAAALSVLINNEMARPLGADGEVVTARITRDNFTTFLASH